MPFQIIVCFIVSEMATGLFSRGRSMLAAVDVTVSRQGNGNPNVTCHD